MSVLYRRKGRFQIWIAKWAFTSELHNQVCRKFVRITFAPIFSVSRRKRRRKHTASRKRRNCRADVRLAESWTNSCADDGFRAAEPSEQSVTSYQPQRSASQARSPPHNRGSSPGLWHALAVHRRLPEEHLLPPLRLYKPNRIQSPFWFILVIF